MEQKSERYKMVAVCPEEKDRIRLMAFNERISQGELVRRALCAYEREQLKSIDLDKDE